MDSETAPFTKTPPDRTPRAAGPRTNDGADLITYRHPPVRNTRSADQRSGADEKTITGTCVINETFRDRPETSPRGPEVSAE
jgi:hypothetical protein